MSPYFFDGTGAYVFTVNSNGVLSYGSVDIVRDVRPVINLKADVKITGGNGTSTNPYTIG